MFIVIADEDFEDCWGGITRKGDVLETNMHEDLGDFLEYLNNQYGPKGQDIKVKWRRAE